MLDSRSSMNIIPLKVMKAMGLEATRPYGNVCGIYSRQVQTYGLIKTLRSYSFAFPRSTQEGCGNTFPSYTMEWRNTDVKLTK